MESACVSCTGRLIHYHWATWKPCLCIQPPLKTQRNSERPRVGSGGSSMIREGSEALHPFPTPRPQASLPLSAPDLHSFRIKQQSSESAGSLSSWSHWTTYSLPKRESWKLPTCGLLVRSLRWQTGFAIGVWSGTGTEPLTMESDIVSRYLKLESSSTEVHSAGV